MRRAGSRVAKVGIAVAVAAAAPLLHWAIASGRIDGPLAALLCGAPHALAYSGLLAVFGLSLRAGREPVITAMARQVRGTLTAEVAVYARRCTWAWAIFFAGQLAMSAILLLAAPFEIWSLFVNVLNWPLVVLMFGAEYIWRRTKFKHHPAEMRTTLRLLAQGSFGQAGGRRTR